MQDFEPYFYPVGTTSLLAENTYRMGLHGVTIGRCFAQKLRAEFGMTVDSFKYGCDISRYRRVRTSRRSGVVFYARRETARRGFELGLMALEVFAARRPDVKIHIYGDRIGKLPFPFVDHGHVTPDELNDIYNECYAGLSLSFTNVSLVALEMLAAGCIPVVNDTDWFGPILTVRLFATRPHIRRLWRQRSKQWLIRVISTHCPRRRSLVWALGRGMTRALRLMQSSAGLSERRPAPLFLTEAEYDVVEGDPKPKN